MAEHVHVKRAPSVLDVIERVGNRLPDPAMLFILAALAIMVLSQVGSSLGWSVAEVRPAISTASAEGTPLDTQTGRPELRLVETGREIRPVSLLTSSGLYWALSNMVRNFINFPPLGVVLVGMLGVGLAEKSGFISALIRAAGPRIPERLLTPAVVFLGVNASLTVDAGFVVLPPLAAALYLSRGRDPIAGIAAVYSAIGGGFAACLLVTSLDPLLAGITNPAVHLIDTKYHVNDACNWYFKIGATIMLTLVGWGVSCLIVEPRILRASATRAEAVDPGATPEPPGGPAAAAHALSDHERAALRVGLAALAATLCVIAAAIFVPGAPLNGMDRLPSGVEIAKWTRAVVPMLFFVFAAPGLAYGMRAGTVRNEKDAARLLAETIAGVAPMVVIAFFAAQFIEYFNYSRLGEMLALTGGKFLASADLNPYVLLVLFIIVASVLNLLISSSSAMWTLMAPIFVPMFMLVGIAPELTQATYRIGDSVTNIVTPLNSYIIIILGVMQRYDRRAGLGTLMSMMTPYSIAFWLAWTALLLAWVALGLPLGPGGRLFYVPG